MTTNASPDTPTIPPPLEQGTLKSVQRWSPRHRDHATRAQPARRRRRKDKSGHPGAQRLAAFAAFTISFFVIGVIWVKHHALFALASRIDRSLLFYNSLLLMWVTTIPFTTATLASYLRAGGTDTRTSVLLYGASSEGMAISFTLILRHLVRHKLLHQAGRDACPLRAPHRLLIVERAPILPTHSAPLARASRRASDNARAREGLMVTAHARLSTAAASLAPELTPVRVNVIAAGFVDTPLSAAPAGDGLEQRRQRERLPLVALSRHRMGRSVWPSLALVGNSSQTSLGRKSSCSPPHQPARRPSRERAGIGEKP
jgi:hypothetical protein